MAKGWALPIALWGDTDGMREAGEMFLPSRKGEKSNGVLNENYHTRLNETTLSNYYTPAVKNLTGKVFEKPVVIGEAIQAKSDWWDNVDLQGSNLNDFASEIFEAAAKLGMSFILVDAPSDGESTSLAEQIAKNVRPYMTHITADQVIGIKTAEINNLTTLIEVRILETIIEENDDYEQEVVKQVRKIFKNFNEDGSEAQGCSYEIWQEIDGAETAIDTGSISLDEIPLIPVYTNRVGFFEAETYFMTLCNLNLAHWQSTSYQTNILNVARVPRLGAFGFTDEEIEQFKKHGVANGIFSTNPEARAEWTEAKGDSIASGERDLASLESQMERRSLDPVLKTASASDVATIANIEQSKSNSVLQSWSEATQRSLNKAIKIMYQLAGEGDIEPDVKLNDNFNIVSDVEKKAKQLLEDYIAGTMSLETLLNERKRIGYVDDDFDIDAELENLKADSGLFYTEGSDG